MSSSIIPLQIEDADSMFSMQLQEQLLKYNQSLWDVERLLSENQALKA